MAAPFPDSYNPFEAPATPLGPTLAGPVGTDAEVMRRQYLKHEASVFTVGSLSYLGAFVCALVALALLLGGASIGANPPPQLARLPFSPQVLFGLGGAFFALLAVLQGALGAGIRRLQPWARWTMLVLLGFNALIVLGNLAYILVVIPVAIPNFLSRNAISILMMGLVLYFLASAKGAIVFSPKYRMAVEQTPYIQRPFSLLAKIVLGIVVALIAFVILAVMVGVGRM